ncbi:MAG: tripartite tricarboxylate transporter permease [Deltaproteobacteria bacterium]
MDVLHYLGLGFSVALSPINLFFCLVGCLIGTLIGVLPGIGPVATLALLLPSTFKLETTSAIIMLCGIYYGAMYGGSTTSILMNIPGETASVVTCLDGYQMARKGRAGPALGMCAFGSFVGGTLSVFGVIFLAPLLSSFALRFGAPEYFSVMVLGLVMVTYLCMGSMLKALIMTVAGLFIAVIGVDTITGMLRFAGGSITLRGGIGVVPIAIGTFGVAEILTNLESASQGEVFKARIKGLLPSLQDWRDSAGAMTRGTLIGFFMGILPGAGTIIPTFMSYAVEKRISKHPEKFGTGIIEAVAAPETANNAATGGSMIPLLSLGIPTSPVMALLLGAFVIHGIQPGPLLISQHPNLFWGVVTSMYIGNAMLLALNLPLIGVWIQVLRMPYPILVPLILYFCIIGVYSLNANIYEVLIMGIFGLIGYLMRKFKYEAAPFLLAIVLGDFMETNFRQSLLYSEGDPLIFFKRPLSAIVLGIALVLLFLPILRRKKARAWVEKVRKQMGDEEY